MGELHGLSHRPTSAHPSSDMNLIPGVRSMAYADCRMRLRFKHFADRLHAALDITRDARVLAGASLPVDGTNVFTAIATSSRFLLVPRGGASVTLLQQRAPQTVRARARTSCTGRRRPSARRRTVAAASEPPGDQPQPAPSCWGVGEQSSGRSCALIETGGLPFGRAGLRLYWPLGTQNG